MEKNREKLIKELEEDSQRFMESPMGQRILTAKYDDNYDDVTKILMDLEEPLTVTADRLRKGQY